MAQLNVYVPEKLAATLRRRALREKKSLSALVAGLLDEHTAKERWPTGFFEAILGQWEGKLARIERMPAQERDEL